MHLPLNLHPNRLLGACAVVLHAVQAGTRFIVIPCNNGLLHSKDLIPRVLMVAARGGGGLRSPKPEKIAVNCGKIVVKIAVHFFSVPRLYASHEQQTFCKKVFWTNYAPNS